MRLIYQASQRSLPMIFATAVQPFIGIAKELRRLNCHKVVLYVTHGIFSKGIEVFNGLLDQLFTSDSFPQQPSDKISVIAFAAK